MKFAIAIIACAVVADASQTGANPIRRVVTMLENMQKKVVEEGKKEKALFDKSVCYCKKGKESLKTSIDSASEKIPQLEADIKEIAGSEGQLKEELAQHKKDREEAKTAVAEAKAIREKEAAAFKKSSTELAANIAALKKAVKALRSGMGYEFLQAETGSLLRKLAVSLSADDRETLTAFLSNKQAPAGGTSEIIGILTVMGTDMQKDLDEEKAADAAAKANFEALSAAKRKEIAAATKAVEEKTERLGTHGVDAVNMKNDLEDTKESLEEDTKFLAGLDGSCKTRETEWAAREKTRADELLAISETVKILNDDDALDLFKSTLGKKEVQSLLQVGASAGEVKAQALKLVATAVSKTSSQSSRVGLELIAQALKGKKVGFEKVLKMIDSMIETLKKEQADDESHKGYCSTEFAKSADQEKETVRTIHDVETVIASEEETIAALKTDIKALNEGIVALDKSVAQATEQRKAENADFTELMVSDNAAKQLLAIAKNRLQKFYNPKLHKPAPARVLTEEERIASNFGEEIAPTPAPGGIAGTGVTVFAQVRSHAAPPKEPESFGKYAKKSEESGGVMALMDMLVQDLTREMSEAKSDENQAQKDFERLLQDSKDKRAVDSKSITEKEGAKAEVTADVQTHRESHKSEQAELLATRQYIQALHGDCDFLMHNFDLRKEARTSEQEALKQAKAVLNGASFSLVQKKSKGFLA